jgi:signal peptidase I
VIFLQRALIALALLFGVVVVVVVLALATGVVRAFEVPSSSMEPTLHCARPQPNCEASRDDRVLVVKYVLASPGRGDLIAFHTPTQARLLCGTGGIYIKRIAAGPGDTWAERVGYSYVNGRRQAEGFVPAAERDDRSDGPIHVPAGHYFVLGDNRAASCDSRVWGLVARSEIVGRVFATYWPPNRISAR